MNIEKVIRNSAHSISWLILPKNTMLESNTTTVHIIVARKSMGNKPFENLNRLFSSKGMFELRFVRVIADAVDEKSNNAGLIRSLMPRMLWSVVSPC